MANNRPTGSGVGLQTHPRTDRAAAAVLTVPAAPPFRPEFGRCNMAKKPARKSRPDANGTAPTAEPAGNPSVAYGAFLANCFLEEKSALIESNPPDLEERLANRVRGLPDDVVAGYWRVIREKQREKPSPSANGSAGKSKPAQRPEYRATGPYSPERRAAIGEGIRARHTPTMIQDTIARPDFHVTNDIRATSDPLWQHLAAFRRRLMEGGTLTPAEWQSLLFDIRNEAHAAGLRPHLGKVGYIVATLNEVREGDPGGAWNDEPDSWSKVILTACGEAGWIQLHDLLDGFADTGIPADKHKRAIAIEWAESWMNARERQLAYPELTWMDPRLRDQWESESRRIETQVDEVCEWYNAKANQLVREDCPIGVVADLFDATLELLGTMRLAFCNLPPSQAMKACAEIWFWLNTEYQHEVGAHLVRVGLDSKPWTRFLCAPTADTLADAIAACQDAFHRCHEGVAKPPFEGAESEENANAKPNEHRSKLSAQDNGEYRPATWFPKGMAPRLRVAAAKNRKTKRVAKRKIDGVVCYSVADVRRWWPADVPKQA